MSERPTFAARAVERWSPPSVEGTPLPRKREATGTATAVNSAPGQQAEAAGYAAGRARAQAEISRRTNELDLHIEHFKALLEELAQPMRLLDTQMEDALLTLAVAIGSQLARRALHADPAQLIAVVRECLKQLPLGARDVRVHMHPEDAAVMRSRLTAPAAEPAWTVIEDATLTRGGCLIESEHSQLDARFESRLHALVASALGDERGEERAGAAAPASEPGA